MAVNCTIATGFVSIIASTYIIITIAVDDIIISFIVIFQESSRPLRTQIFINCS